MPLSNLENIFTEKRFNDASTARGVIFIINVLFLIWGFFDFYETGLFFPFIFTIRFFLFISIIILISPINRKSFDLQYNLYMSAIFTTLSSLNMFYIMSIMNPQAHIVFQIVFLFVTPQLFNSKPKYYIPVVLMPYTILLISVLAGSLVLEKAALIVFAFALLSSISFIIQYLGYVRLFRFKKLEKEFKRSQVETDDLSNENNQLIRILCHDLGNSITIVQLSSEQISREVEKQSMMNTQTIDKALYRIERGISTQQEIIEHVKEKVSLESGKQVLDIVPVNLKIIFEKLNFFFADQLSKKQIELIINYTKEKSPYVMADLATLSNHVLNNILSNAIKFSPNGSNIVISCWSDNESTYVTVEDSGIGIPHDILSNIFKANVKTTRKGLNGEKGTGFGMPLAKTYMEKYGGEIIVDSKENKGTRITLKFKNIKG